MQISADHTDTLNEAREGQIVALHGLQSVQTGDTLLSNQKENIILSKYIYLEN